MDMRTIEKIEFGSALAVRAFLDAETARELSERFIAFDTETTGLDPDRDCIVELGAVLFEKGIPTKINGEVTESVAVIFLGDAASGKVLVCGHVAAFDLSFLCNTLDRLGIEAAFRFIDTRQLATQIPELEHHSLAAVAEYFEIPHEKAHQAKEDALTSGRILLKKLERS